MAPPPKGHFVLHTIVKPPVTAGKYELISEQTGTPFDVHTERTNVTVASPRYTMPPEQILSAFPPANAEGAFGDRLPQVVLKRRTLPWERNPFGGLEVSETPWLALVVVAEGEAELSTPVPVADCTTAGTALLHPEERDVDQGVHLAVTETVVRKIFPTKDDLALLVHVREVDVSDTELANGDDDGWLAVVLANRLPVFDTAAGRPVRYLACLVNVEGQTHELPPPTQPVDHFSFELAQDWSALATITADPDQWVTGTGVQVLPAAGGGFDAAPAAGPGARVRTGATIDGAKSASAVPAAQSWRASAAATDATVAVSAAALDPDAGRLVRDTMGMGWRFPISHYALERVLRFPVLAHWSFTTSEGATFETLMHGLDVGLLGTRPDPEPDDPPRPTGTEVIETGHLRLPHRTRRGDTTTAWYRGPLVPHPADRETPTAGRLSVAHASDQLRRVVPDGHEDVGLAAGFEIGRLLALSQLSVVAALLRFRRDHFGAARLRHQLREMVPFDLGPLLDSRLDISQLVTSSFFEHLAREPVLVAGPGRPVADPGRPIEELAGLSADRLDAVVAAGLGIDVKAVRDASRAVGVAAALDAIQVPVAGGDRFTDQTVAALGDALHAEVGRLAEIALPQLRTQARGAAAAAPPRDALDDLLEALDDDEGGGGR